MTIKPIDLQTNISQMHEVGRGEHARSGAVAEQQHLLDKESSEKSQLANSKLDESKKGDKTDIKDALAKDKEKRETKEKKKKSVPGEEKDVRDLSKDERMGRIIDVLK